MTSTKTRSVSLAILLGVVSAGPSPAAIVVKYGSPVTAEFRKAEEVHRYEVSVNAGDKLKIIIKPIGDTLHATMGFFDPSDVLIGSDPPMSTILEGEFDDEFRKRNPRMRHPALMLKDKLITDQQAKELLKSYSRRPQDRKKGSSILTTAHLSANGKYSIFVTNGPQGGSGEYQVIVEATLKDGTPVKQGDAPSEPGRPAPKAEAPTFNGVGFPGLAPVDFADAVMFDLPDDGVARGKISSPTDKNVRGFTITPQAKGAYDVTLSRTRGSFPLGLVILSPANEVLAQSSLIVSEKFVTTLTFPPGSSTIGIYRLDLGKSIGKDTEFEIKAVKHN